MKIYPHFATLLLALISVVWSSSGLASFEGIEMSGTAKVSVVPDMAQFSFAVNARGKSLPALKSEIDRKTTAVIALCKKLDIDTKHISSAEVSIHPQYNHQTRELIGYDISRNINVELHNLERYSDLINGAIKSGITTVNNINLGVRSRSKLEAQALADAVKAARTKAEIVAKNAGIQLGKVISVRESGSNFDNRRYQFRANGEDAMAGQLQGAFEPGEISVTATVVVTFTIQ